LVALAPEGRNPRGEGGFPDPGQAGSRGAPDARPDSAPQPEARKLAHELEEEIRPPEEVALDAAASIAVATPGERRALERVFNEAVASAAGVEVMREAHPVLPDEPEEAKRVARRMIEVVKEAARPVESVEEWREVARARREHAERLLQKERREEWETAIEGAIYLETALDLGITDLSLLEDIAAKRNVPPHVSEEAGRRVLEAWTIRRF